jgi:AcrR family transcriptional regulator
MSTRISTADRIVETGRRLFNTRGYAGTSLAEIAAAVGISPGNLNYHFPTKKDLALRIHEDAREVVRARRSNRTPGKISDDYVEHVLFTMNITWNNRFILRDQMHITDGFSSWKEALASDFTEFYSLFKRIDSEGMFRHDPKRDLRVLTRSIWIVGRYWMDYLRESEGLEEITWADQERGIQHHFALLLPCLTAPARQEFELALDRVPAKLAEAAFVD